jgi:hypothetical protein
MSELSRRDYLKILGAGAAIAGMGSLPMIAQNPQNLASDEPSDVKADRARRMKWWHEAKFGMFIHWGLYSVVGRHEWVMEMEGFRRRSMRSLPSSSIRSRMPPAIGRGLRNARAKDTW